MGAWGKGRWSGCAAQVDADLMEQLGRWVEELDVMEQLGYKADIEAVYSVGGYAGLMGMLVGAVLRREYL